MPYNAKVAKPVYYKQPVKTFPQLQKNILRLQHDKRMCGSTKADYMTLMYESYKDYCNVKELSTNLLWVV